MGDLALGASFEMLVHERWHYAIAMMRKFMWLYGPFSAVPWLARIGFSIPGAAQGWKDFIVWCRQRMTERIMVGKMSPSIQATKQLLTLFFGLRIKLKDLMYVRIEIHNFVLTVT